MRIASLQFNVVFDNPTVNAGRAATEISRLAAEGVEVLVFPECFLTGYCVETRHQAEALAILRDHPALARIQQAALDAGVVVVVGFAEKADDTLFNTAAIFEADQAPRYYRKTHLPKLGYDRFATPGHELPVFETRFGRIGVLICFDQRFPEPVRVQALAGVDVVVLPTNWPDGAQVSADSICVARAAENRIWFVTCDRVGTENGFSFIGKSKIISPTGKVVASTEADEAVLVADMDLALARQKRTVTIPGKYETDVFAPRQPELYRSLGE